MITAKEIVAYRARLGISQSALAKEVGLTAAALSAIETGKSIPRAATLVKVKQTLQHLENKFIFSEDRNLRKADELLLASTSALVSFYRNLPEKHKVSAQEELYKVMKEIVSLQHKFIQLSMDTIPDKYKHKEGKQENTDILKEQKNNHHSS